ncbi:MAG: hypothetical protein ABIS01_02475, partial [Ferruginibacter sp.]
MNTPLATPLWDNIRSFSFDDPASGFPFSKKLQQDNNWTSDFTTSAIEEYRKFIYLCCILPNGASPSETIDKVWHLHLTYTTNYWTDLCKKTLHKDIHHYPTKGGPEEHTKHTNWYRQTLEKYAEVFGTEPPVVIWPGTAFAAQEHAFEIYHPNFFNKTVLTFIALTILFIAAVNLYGSTGPNFLLYYSIIMVAGLLVSWALQEHKLKKLALY